MNNAKIWLVVNPTVGIPLFLGAVAVSSFAVHVGIVANTSWIADYHAGKPLGTGDGTASATLLPEADADVAKAAYVMPSTDGTREVTITMSDGTTVKAILQPPEVLASIMQ